MLFSILLGKIYTFLANINQVVALMALQKSVDNVLKPGSKENIIAGILKITKSAN